MMEWYLILLPLVFCLYPLWEARRDYKAIQADWAANTLGYKWHRQSATVTGLVILFLAIPVLRHSLLLAAVTILYLASLFWFIFDARLNGLLKRPPWYVGYTSRSEKLLRKISKDPETTMLIVKTAMLMVSAFFYYRLW